MGALAETTLPLLGPCTIENKSPVLRALEFGKGLKEREVVLVFAEIGHVYDGLLTVVRAWERFVRRPIDGVSDGRTGGFGVRTEEWNKGRKKHLAGSDMAERFTQTIRTTALVAGKGSRRIGVKELQERCRECARVGEVNGFVGPRGKDKVRVNLTKRGLKTDADTLCEVKCGKGSEQACTASGLQEKFIQKADEGPFFGDGNAMKDNFRGKRDGKRFAFGLSRKQVDTIAALDEGIGQGGGDTICASAGAEDVLVNGKNRGMRAHRPEISERPCSRIKVAARSAALSRSSKRVVPCPSCVRNRVR